MSHIEVKIPALGESIATGILAKWHVADGDIVKKDQPLYELETDKITSEGAAESAGRITLKVPAGAEVKIGAPIATIDTAAAPDTPPAKPATAPSPFPASPAVRRLAADTGIDPATIPGTGKAGRVTKADLLAATAAPPIQRGPDAPPAESSNTDAPPMSGSAGIPARDIADKKARAPAMPAPHPPAPTPRQTRKKLTPLRQRIAQRLVQAQHAAAMLTTFNECDLSAIIALRARYQDDFTKRHAVKLGLMSFFTKAVVHALQAVPAINARLDGDTIVQNHYYDIGVAVSTEKGLMVPVIRDCDRLDMAGIERAIADAANRARESKITLADLEGGVFTITNGGLFGSLLSTPILNSPQSAILGLHAINDRPVARDGQIVIRPMMWLALSYDHRLIDGKEAVTFLLKIKQTIEDPARLALDV